jgi:hypothetical protein
MRWPVSITRTTSCRSAGKTAHRHWPTSPVCDLRTLRISSTGIRIIAGEAVTGLARYFSSADCAHPTVGHRLAVPPRNDFLCAARTISLAPPWP